MSEFDPTLLDALFHGEGYFLGMGLQPAELEIVREIIKSQWLRKIDEAYPQYTKQFQDIGIENYHQLAHLLEHSKLWPKKNRMLNKQDSATVRGLGLFKRLEKYLGQFQIIDGEKLGFEEFTWRLVRPNEQNDIGPMHQDVWFTDLYDVNVKEGQKRVTIWTAIMTEPGLSGLRVAPGTQNTDFPYHIEERFGMKKPVIDVKDEELDITPCYTNPGDSIVFNPKLLHGGMVSRGSKCRISLECVGIFDGALVPKASDSTRDVAASAAEARR